MLKFISLLLLSTSAFAHSFDNSLFYEEKAKPLNREDIMRYASTSLDVKNSQILQNNNLAYEAKLSVIEDAVNVLKQKGYSQLYLNYYIFSEDESSSHFASKLVSAAQQGVKVKITLDFLQAYPKLDFYRWMAREGKGNIEFYFYGRPTNKIILDSIHLASPCIDNGVNLLKSGKSLSACTSFKKQNIMKNIDVNKFDARQEKYAYPSLLLSGMYAKNPKVMMKAILEANQISMEDLVGDESSSLDEETKESLKEFLKLLYNSKTSDGVEKLFHSLKLKIALARYGQQLQPLYNLLTGLIPMTTVFDSIDESNEKHVRDWMYLTDYTHHKIILSNHKKLVMGGRNIENSYHMEPNPLTDKYIFMDTDILIDLNKENLALTNTQTKIHNFKDLVISLDELLEIMPNDLTGAMRLAPEICLMENSPLSDASCIDSKILSLSQNSKQRLDYIGNRTKEASLAFEKHRVDLKVAGIHVDPKARYYYLENLHFDKEDPNLKRIFGVKESREDYASNSKAINEVWLRAMEAQCEKKERQKIYLYNAYFLPSANFAKLLAKMTDGTLDCSNVEVKIITNSVETTDLGVINIFARHWLSQFSNYYINFFDAKRSAKLSYYEYNKEALQGSNEATDSNFSLHSKISLFGDSEMIIGSANLDVRSYARDTNNAVYIENAPNALTKLRTSIDEKIKSGSIKKIPVSSLALNKKQLREIDYQSLSYMNNRRCYKNNLAPNNECEYLSKKQFDSAFEIYSSLMNRFNSLLEKLVISPMTYEEIKDTDYHYSENGLGRDVKIEIHRKQKPAMDAYDYGFGFL